MSRDTIKVPKHLFIAQTRSVKRTCFHCKHCDYFGDYSIHECERWNTTLENPAYTTCRAFSKRGKK